MVDQVNISEARSKVYDFSEPYTYAGQQLMVRKDRQAAPMATTPTSISIS